RRNVDPVTEEFATVDHNVAKIDADPKVHLQAFRQVERLNGKAVLDLKSCAYCFDGACKLDHDTVASAAKNPSMVSRHDLRDRGTAQSERAVRTLLIPFHECAVAGHVGS